MMVTHAGLTLANKPASACVTGSPALPPQRNNAKLGASTAIWRDSRHITPHSLQCATSPSQDGHYFMDHREKKGTQSRALNRRASREARAPANPREGSPPRPKGTAHGPWNWAWRKRDSALMIQTVAKCLGQGGAGRGGSPSEFPLPAWS